MHVSETGIFVGGLYSCGKISKFVKSTVYVSTIVSGTDRRPAVRRGGVDIYGHPALKSFGRLYDQNGLQIILQYSGSNVLLEPQVWIHCTLLSLFFIFKWSSFLFKFTIGSLIGAECIEQNIHQSIINWKTIRRCKVLFELFNRYFNYLKTFHNILSVCLLLIGVFYHWSFIQTINCVNSVR